MSLGRLLLVEDDERLADLLGDYLEQAGFFVEREDNGLRASRRIVTEHPDAVVLDVGLPGIDGLEVLRRVRTDYSGIILMLTARGDELDQVLGLELGADAYVTKPASPRVLVARIKALLRRAQGDWGDPERLELGGLMIDRTRHQASLNDEPMNLSTREFELLWLLASKTGKVISRESIQDALDQELEISGRAVDMMVSRLRSRLGDDPHNPVWIRTIRGRGYLFQVGV